MTPEAQRIAIAEACGWKLDPSEHQKGLWWLNPKDEVCYKGDLPDYLNDLNAMHEAEKVMDESQWNVYILTLQKVCPKKWSSATAAQRAEAFLRTLGTWMD